MRESTIRSTAALRCASRSALVRVVLGLLLLAGLAASAPAAGVSARSSTISLRCASLPPDTRSNLQAVNIGQCDFTTEVVATSAIAEAYLEDEEVFVQTFAGAVDGAVSAEASASLDIDFRVNTTRAPPLVVDTLPVFSFVSSEVSVFGNSVGSANLKLAGPGYEGGAVLAISPPDLSNRRVEVSLVPDAVYTITITASCFSLGNSPAGSDCLALMDPALFFDQEAFDALLGADSFPLSDYYAFEVGAIVPLPAGWVLFGSALLGWRGLRRRR